MGLLGACSRQRQRHDQPDRRAREPAVCTYRGHDSPAPLPDAAPSSPLARARLRRRVLPKRRLVREYVLGHRPGTDRRDDREPSNGSLVEAVHGGAGGAERAAPARFLEPSLERSRVVMESLEQWLGREYRHAATAMLRSVSARDIVKERP